MIGRVTSTNGWNIVPLTIGKFGTDYGLRAVVALIGLGANLADKEANWLPAASGDQHHDARVLAEARDARWDVDATPGEAGQLREVLDEPGPETA